MNTDLLNLLDEWLHDQLDDDGWSWLAEQVELIGAGQLRALYLGFGLVARKISDNRIRLSASQLQAAGTVRTDWHPGHWTLQDTARVRLVLAYQPGDAETFVAALDQLFAAGEVQELIALYQGLPLYPFAELLRLRAAEGIRTNMGSVFQAVAQRNPYPAEQLSTEMWNQLVLKCLFVEISLFPVIGLDTRKNESLSRMLCDYAHERWAASRTISPELWRCVDPIHHPAAIDDLRRVLETGSQIERQAAALSLAASQSDEAAQLLSSQPELSSQLQAGRFSWKSIAETLKSA